MLTEIYKGGAIAPLFVVEAIRKESNNRPLWGRGTALAVDEVPYVRLRPNADVCVLCTATASVKNHRFLPPSPQGEGLAAAPQSFTQLPDKREFDFYGGNTHDSYSLC